MRFGPQLKRWLLRDTWGCFVDPWMDAAFQYNYCVVGGPVHVDFRKILGPLSHKNLGKEISYRNLLAAGATLNLSANAELFLDHPVSGAGGS